MANWFSGLIDRILGLNNLFDVDQPPAPDEPTDPSEWPNWPAGSKPHSIRLPKAKLYRYQDKKYLETGATWYHMAWDLDRKWAAKNRYSGKDISPGHFFSVHPNGALAEMNAYDADVSGSELLEYTISIDNLLDLTDIEALSWFYKKHFAPENDWHWGVMLDSLFDQQMGGDNHNAFAGHKALLDGYNGIVFFGARASERFWADPGSMRHRDWDLVAYDHEAMRQEPECINVVIYFGHNVVGATHEIVYAVGKIENALFGAGIEEIDAVFAGDPLKPSDVDLHYETLRERVERIAWLGKPGIVEEELGGG
jgi:hypothetical protein